MVAVVDDESSDLPESSESSSSGSSLDDGVSDAVARKTLAKGRTELPEDTDDKVPCYHPNSATLRFRNVGVFKFQCGRQSSKTFIKTKWSKAPGLIECAQCFKVVLMFRHAVRFFSNITAKFATVS